VIELKASPRRRIDFLALFFDSSGRVGRIGFVLKISVLMAILTIYDVVPRGGVVRLLTGWLVNWPLFFSAACVLSQRLHDQGRTGWWGAPILLAFCLSRPEIRGALGVIALVLIVAAPLWLSVAPGEPGFNRYGPPPRKP
jgi:uncharacterized membrane protein YhaH (DUF805 family)